MYWHRIAYFELMAPLGIYSLTQVGRRHAVFYKSVDDDALLDMAVAQGHRDQRLVMEWLINQATKTH